MDEATCSRRDVASVVFNLPGYDVIDAVDLPLGGRRVVVQAVERDEGCPDCGVISTRLHAWVKQRVCDIPAGGDVVEVVVRSPRMVCAEDRCWRKTFTHATETFIDTRVTNARTEAANTGIKHIKRTGRGYRNHHHHHHHHYQRRILLRSHRQTPRRRTRLNQQATAAHWE